MIETGAALPDATFFTPSADGPSETTTAALFTGKKAVLFGVPGAFTPTCDQNHLPGFVAEHAALAEKGVDLVACVAVNDIFVVTAWAQSAKVGDAVTMLADGSALFTTAIGMDLDLTERGLGIRSKRYAMIVEDRVVRAVMVEDSPANHDRSSAASVLAAL